MSSRPGDLILDPFGGSGTTFDVCERIGRRWIGIEIEDCSAIVARLRSLDVSWQKSNDWVEGEA
jgi:site-specific DNA-methyltransferase (adenine-specific)